MHPTMDRSRPRIAFLLLATLLLCVGATRADAPAAAARAGLDLASAAAKAWAPDAEFVYLENDEPVDATGRSARWGYLFRSSSLGRSRAWSVRDGRIVSAEDLAFRFDAPVLPASWLDSDAAVTAVEKAVASASKREARGRLQTMFLLRGVSADEEFTPATWTFVYSSANGGALHVVVDAVSAKVLRAWRA